MEIQELGSFITPTNKEEYCIGFVNGYLCVWAPELGPEESLVLVDDLPNNWGGDDGDLEALINAAREMEACTTRKEPDHHGGKEYVAEAHRAPSGVDGGGDMLTIYVGNELVYGQRVGLPLRLSGPGIDLRIEKRINAAYDKRNSKRGRPRNPPGVPNHNPKFEIRLRPEVEAWAQQNRQRVAEMLERAAREDGAL